MYWEAIICWYLALQPYLDILALLYNLPSTWFLSCLLFSAGFWSVETIASKNPKYSSWQNRRRWCPTPLGAVRADHQAVISSSCLARSAQPGSVMDVAILLVALADPLHLPFRHLEDVCNFSRRLGLVMIRWFLMISIFGFLVWSWTCWQKQCWALTDDLKLNISAFIAQSYLQLTNHALWLFCSFFHYGLEIGAMPLQQDFCPAKKLMCWLLSSSKNVDIFLFIFLASNKLSPFIVNWSHCWPLLVIKELSNELLSILCTCFLHPTAYQNTFFSVHFPLTLLSTLNVALVLTPVSAS